MSVSPLRKGETVEVLRMAPEDACSADMLVLIRWQGRTMALRHPDVILVPTPQGVVDPMLKMAGVHKGDVVYDLGSGDGRIVVTAARGYAVKGIGIDKQRGLALIAAGCNRGRAAKEA
ncbi:MAG: calcium-binding protein [Bryobacteraceae bacterium]